MTRENKAQAAVGRGDRRPPRKHTLFEWSAQSKVDPIPVDAREGGLLLDAGGEAVHRLQQPAHVRQHRPRRRAGDQAIQEQAATPRLREPVHGDRAARAPRGEARRDRPRRHRHLLLHERRRRGERERDQDRARRSPGATRSSRATARTTARPAERSPLTGDPRRWAAEPGMPGVVHVLDPYHGIAARLGRRGDRPRATSRRRSSSRGRSTIAAFILETVTGTNGILIPPDGYLQGVRALCDTPRHPDDLRRGHGRLRAHRRVVRGRPLGRRPRPHHDGEGPHRPPTCRSAPSAMRRHIADALPGQGLLRRAHLQQPPGGLRGRARHDRGLRGGPARSSARGRWATC